MFLHKISSRNINCRICISFPSNNILICQIILHILWRTIHWLNLGLKAVTIVRFNKKKIHLSIFQQLKLILLLIDIWKKNERLYESTLFQKNFWKQKIKLLFNFKIFIHLFELFFLSIFTKMSIREFFFFFFFLCRSCSSWMIGQMNQPMLNPAIVLLQLAKAQKLCWSKILAIRPISNPIFLFFVFNFSLTYRASVMWKIISNFFVTLASAWLFSVISLRTIENVEGVKQ